LSEEEEAQVRRLQQREREVIAHERAHKIAGGQYAGAVNYKYQRGPDGRNYIVGGEVQLDVSKERTPQATIRKMKQIRAAALAPARPSSKDFAIAAEASRIMAQAQMEKAKETYSNTNGQPPGQDRHEPPVMGISTYA
jgi:hypothetical protein